METTVCIALQQQNEELFKNLMKKDQTKNLFASTYTMKFDPDAKTLKLMHAMPLEGSTRELTEGFFNKTVDGLYGFTTSIALSDRSEGQPFYETVTLRGMEYKDLAKQNPSLVASVEMLRILAEMLDAFDIKPDSLKKPTASQQEPFEIIEKYEAGKIFEKSELAEEMSQTFTTGDNKQPVYMDIIRELGEEINDRHKYGILHLHYITDDFTPDNNPFHDFITNLQKPDAEPDMAFFQLAGTLQKLCL